MPFNMRFRICYTKEKFTISLFTYSSLKKKVHSYCPRSVQTIHPCLSNPTRRAWAMRQCSVMKSDPFKACHSEVDYQPYYSRCVFDTCGCDNGGDCECLCTAIASYAQECNAHGVPIHWRSNHLCRE